MGKLRAPARTVAAVLPSAATFMGTGLIVFLTDKLSTGQQANRR